MTEGRSPSTAPAAAERAPDSCDEAQLWIWRHPRARGAEGRCIGHTDLPVDSRRAKRLAHRIRAAARRNGLPRRVCTSPLKRARAVGRWLRQWGWRHELQAQLLEMDFGCWEGRLWTDIERAEIDNWCADFALHRPGAGESLSALFQRAASWTAEPGAACIVVGHAGWMLARRWLTEGQPMPTHSSQWPAAPGHGELWRLPSFVPPEDMATPLDPDSGEVR
jgi:alpha-ribazole phosphatase